MKFLAIVYEKRNKEEEVLSGTYSKISSESGVEQEEQ